MTTGRISAGNNLTIDIAPDHWRLLVNGDHAERVLVEAAPGEPLRYMPTFGQRRRLPDTGVLPILYIQRVALGWSVKDESWHLGLVLEPELAEARGSRWCEIAHWPDPDQDVYVDVASDAGNGLAKVVTRPFDLIPPRPAGAAVSTPAPPPTAAPRPFAPEVAPVFPTTPTPDAAPYAPTYAPAPAYAPPAPPRPLPGLPLKLDEWTLTQAAPDTLEFKRSGAWTRGKWMRVFWYLLFTIIYLVLSITTLQARIALPKPEFLPYLGLASAAILFLLMIATVLRIGRTPNRIVVQSGRGVTALRGNGQRWQVSPAEIDGVYASQVVSRKLKRDKRTIYYGELSVLRNDGKFRFLLENSQVEEKPVAVAEDTPAEEGVTPLSSNEVESNMQAAAAHMARVLNVAAWYDQRLK